MTTARSTPISEDPVDRASHRTAHAALWIGAICLLTFCLATMLAWSRSRTLVVDGLAQSHHAIARSLVDQVGAQRTHSTVEALQRYDIAWQHTLPVLPQRYLCVIGQDGRLLFHSLRPDMVGSDARDVPLPGAGPGAPQTVGELLAAGVDWTGENVNLAGRPQVAAYVYDRSIPALVAVHIPDEVVRGQIWESLWPWLLAFGFGAFVLMPLALLLIYRVFCRSAARVAASEARLRDLFENAPCMLLSVDAQTARIVECNRLFAATTGYSREESIGKRVHDIYAPEHAAKVGELFEQFRQTGVVKDAELLLATRTGRHRTVLVSVQGIRDEHGKVVRSRTALTDITDYQQLREQLHQSQRVEAIGALAAGIAHDFNNCLTAIAGFAELARSQIDPRQLHQTVDQILAGANRATGLTRALLSFSRKTPGERLQVPLANVVQETVRFLGSVLPAAIEVRTDLAVRPPVWVEADATQIGQVLTNLVLNARDAMPHGGRLTIGIEPDAEHRRVAVVITDTGCGIPSDLQSRVFEPFFTTKPREEGSGLGLAMVRRIVEDHGGTVALTSREGHGTTVRVLLPTCLAAATSSPGDSGPIDWPCAGATILVAEDDVLVSRLIVRLLQGAGYRVLDANDGEQALQLFLEHRDQIALLLFDIDLPSRSGTSCLAEVRRCDPSVPVILISGKQVPEIESDLRTRFVQKPFSARCVRRAMAELMVGA